MRINEVNFAGVVTGIFGPVASGKTHLIKQHVLAKHDRWVGFDYSGELDGYETIVASPKQLIDRLKRNRFYFQLAYVPAADVMQDFEWCLWSLWHLPIDSLLVLDEVHRICPVSGISDSVETMLRFARHAHLGVVAASQRIADVSKLFTGGCRNVLLFYTQEARDLDAIEDRYGCADMVQNLRPLVFDDITKQTKQTPQVVLCRRGKSPEVIDL